LTSNKKIDINLALKEETSLMTQNVVAILEGSDPVLKNEYVAIGAHYDHDGMNPHIEGPDKIYNGADDDGSGTTGVLAIAEALTKSPKRPKRSILFVWHAGEERGLWGSEYFTKYPTVPLDKVITHLNIDMIGRSKKPGDTNPKNKELTGENEIYVIGPKLMSTQLENVTDSVNKSFLNLSYNSKYDDPKDPNQFFFRSDHYHYAAKGVPIVFWFNGVHEDYHQPGDSPDKIDYQKMEKITRTIFLTLWELADAKERPKIDKQLPSN
jgi:Zn-dependent M28 family amino/carboxypeptidase